MASPIRQIWTIGHSNHALEDFLDLLAAHGIEILADVRSRPYSRYVPHFSRDVLRESVTNAGLEYLFIGRELGGRPVNSSLYDDEGYVRYDAIAETPRFRAGIARVLAGCARWRVALLCAEDDPTRCHRRRLVGRVLVEGGVRLVHVRGDGTVVEEAELAAREAPPVVQLGLFADGREGLWRSTRSALRDTRRRPSSGR